MKRSTLCLLSAAVAGMSLTAAEPRSKETAAIALSTSSQSLSVVADGLDARYRSAGETSPIAFKSFPAVGFLLFLR